MIPPTTAPAITPAEELNGNHTSLLIHLKSSYLSNMKKEWFSIYYKYDIFNNWKEVEISLSILVII